MLNFPPSQVMILSIANCIAHGYVSMSTYALSVVKSSSSISTENARRSYFGKRYLVEWERRARISSRPSRIIKRTQLYDNTARYSGNLTSKISKTPIHHAFQNIEFPAKSRRFSLWIFEYALSPLLPNQGDANHNRILLSKRITSGKERIKFYPNKNIRQENLEKPSDISAPR